MHLRWPGVGRAISGWWRHHQASVWCTSHMHWPVWPSAVEGSRRRGRRAGHRTMVGRSQDASGGGSSIVAG
uniref:Uncharacterized protein n=1 Tax=Arundo donax TaxID=35708 RepID=A0A0A8XZC8_ARUDO